MKSRIGQFAVVVACAFALTVPALLKSDDLGSPLPPVISPSLGSQLLPPLLTPVTNTLGGILSLLGNAREMKLLVLAADGTEPSLLAIQAILSQMGVPYDLVVLTKTGGALPPLNDSFKGYYQGIILATGNLATCTTNPCSIALPPAGWVALDKYAATYGVRTVSYYTFPDPRYGIVWTGASAPGGAAAFTPAAAAVFPYLKRTAPVPITDAYLYLAAAAPGAGETTTPILTVNGQPTAVIHRKADGREYFALTFDNNPYLLHSLAFGYGLVNWVTKGIFLGQRKVYFSPQIDDVLLASDLFDPGSSSCKPSGFQIDPTTDPTGSCPTLRITSSDLNTIANWQDGVNSGQAGRIKVNMAFNGFGATPAGGAAAGDPLSAAATLNRSKFIWTSHTFDHENLDCYNPVLNSGVCTPATYAQALAEINSNITISQKLGLVEDTPSMVTPNVSGLTNPNFLAAAAAKGIRYLVSDASSMPPSITPNTGVYSPLQPSILTIPRRATSIFYNTATPLSGVASETDEYNYFYGPNGIARIGGVGGPPFFNANQSYSQIIDRESDFILKYMLRGEVYPLMFHQANLRSYNGSSSLFTDLAGATLTKFQSLSGLPVNSLSLSSIGQVVADRMSYNASGVSATLTPGVSMTIKASRSAKIPVTGICKSSCEDNGGQPVSYFGVNPLLPTTVLLLF
ncbi:MAG: hypothetical protein ABJF23_13485 [Bryobacteraceae bacterium]